jgi:small subunit ribosomal protein S16
MVVADSRTSRDGSFIEIIGTYNPQKGPTETKLDTERAQFWLQRGAQPTVTALKLLKRAGLKTA